MELGIVGDQATQSGQLPSVAEGSQVQYLTQQVQPASDNTRDVVMGTYEQDLRDIENYVGGLDVDGLRTLCTRLLEGHGGVSLARSMMDVSPDQHLPPPPQSSPDWCICGHCRHMASPVENVCCRRRNCIVLYEVFHLICLHPIVLRVAVRNNCDWRADPVTYNHSNFRKAAYRQYILWVYGRLGRGNRRVAPSCVVWKLGTAILPVMEHTWDLRRHNKIMLTLLLHNIIYSIPSLSIYNNTNYVILFWKSTLSFLNKFRRRRWLSCSDSGLYSPWMCLREGDLCNSYRCGALSSL